MRILVAGATGSIGIHVVNTAIAMGHQPVTLVRNRRKIKLLPRGTDIFYGDVSIPETLTEIVIPMFPVMQLLHSWVLLSPVMTIH